MMIEQIPDLAEVKVDNFNCHFSEIREVSHCQLHQREIPKNQINNCFAAISGEELLVISRGGTRFHLPMDQKVTALFPLPQGLLIEFSVRPEVKLGDIIQFQKNKNAMEVEEPQELQFDKYCYATLTRHPYNPLKILGEFSNDEIFGWLKVKEKIVWASDQVPLIISYNQELRRSAFHVLLANTQEVAKQYQVAFVPTHSYSLKGLTESPHNEILSQMVFQEKGNTEPVVEVVLNKSVKRGQIIIYAQTVSKEVRVYELDFYGGLNSTRLMTKIPNAGGISPACLYAPDSSILERGKAQDGTLLSQILKEQIAELPDCTAVLQDNFIGYYHNGFLIATEYLAKYSSPVGCQHQHFVDHQGKTIELTPLISNQFDAIVLRTLELVLQDERVIVKALSSYCSGTSLADTLIKVSESRSGLMNALHLLYQQIKLYQLMRVERQKLGELVQLLSFKLGKKQYVDYYLREGFPADPLQSSNETALSLQEVYDVFQTLSNILIKPQILKAIPVLHWRSKFLIGFFQLLQWGEIKIPIQGSLRSENVVRFSHSRQSFYHTKFPILSQRVFHLDYYQQVHDASQMAANKAKSNQQKAFLYLIRSHHSQSEIISYPLGIRSVFAWLLRIMRRELPNALYESIPKLGFELIQREDLFKNIDMYRKKTIQIPYHLQKPSLDDHIKTLVHTSTSQGYFLTSNAAEMNKLNNDLVFEQVQRLLSSTSQIKIRVKDIEAIPEDRWEIESQNILIKFSNRRLAVVAGQGAFMLGTSRSFITDIVKIPKINLSAVMPNDIKITLDLKDDKETIVYWPEFHAGLAAGLRLSRHIIPLSEDHLKTWIFYQKPDTPRRDHAGFLLSLGLLGYLRCFSPTDIYQYLKPNNQFTSVAILLGVSVSNIGNSDQALTKALVLHIPVLLPPSLDVDIPINVQTSALIGVGLIHKGTCNRTMTEMTLSQIGKRPSSDKCLEREGYSLAAGWSLGMICMGMKGKKESFRDLQLEERLIRFIEGGKVIEPPQSMISTNYINETKCSSIKEGPYVNLHITTPAALLAISLMYLKSNDRELSARITIPNSFNTIEECNPTHILLKTVAKNLIMWDDITPTQDFIFSQVPELIRFVYENPLGKVYERYYLVYNVSEIDYQTITSIYLSVITGALMAMALRYAGTGNIAVVKLIRDHIEHLRAVKITKCQFANDPLNKNTIDQYELFSLLSTSLLSMAVVMAGTCDTESLRIARVVRKKFQDSKVFHYGFFMTVNMAIGFIFLGYGNYTFNREDLSVAALLLALYPQFPNAPGDNRWHLQALRHFYVLAMEEKIFHTVDVDTNKVVNVAARMTFKIDGEYQSEDMHTPVLLQQSKKLSHIKIIDDDYFDVDFSFQGSCGDPKAIYIKRKHFKDINPKSLNPENALTTEIAQQKLKKTLKEEPRYLAFIDKTAKPDSLAYLLPGIGQDKLNLISQKLQNPPKNEDLYFKLLKEDKLQMFQIYLALIRETKALTQSNDSESASSISLQTTFEQWIGSTDFNNLIANELAHLKQTLTSNTTEHSELVGYICNPFGKRLQSKHLYRWLKIMKMPSSRQLVVLRQALKIMQSRGESEESLQMNLLLSHPECSQWLLRLILRVCLTS